MKRAPVFPKDENTKSNEVGYDPQIDFSKFLEEARKYAPDAKVESMLRSHENPTEERSRKQNKSWKKALLFWRKFAKKKGDSDGSVSTVESHGSNAANCRRASVSGLMRRGKERAGIGHHGISHPSSGPLAGWFTSTGVEEAVIPYMSLDQQRCSPGDKGFGPIYRVN